VVVIQALLSIREDSVAVELSQEVQLMVVDGVGSNDLWFGYLQGCVLRALDVLSLT
jgi:hypothetical protein